MLAKNVMLSIIALCVVCVSSAAPAARGAGNLLAYSALVADYSKTSGGYSPALSPDGRCLAYMSSNGDVWLLFGDMGGDGPAFVPWKIPVSPLAGDATSTMVMDQGLARNIDWSRDGTRLVFGCKDGRLFVVDQIDPRKRTANVHALAVQRSFSNTLMRVGAIGSPRWSPDGKKIAYLREDFKDSSAYQLCLVDLASERETVLAGDAASKGRAWGQPWSPDGRELVYSSLVKSGGVRKVGLSIVSVDTKKIRRLQAPEGSAFPTWSPKGSIAFVADKEVKVPVACGVDAGIGASAVWVMSGSDAKPLTLSQPLASVEHNIAPVTSSARAQFRAVFKERLGSKLSPDQRTRLANGTMTNEEISDLLWLIPAKSVGGRFQKLSETFVRLTRTERTKKNPNMAALQKASEAALAALPEDRADAFFKNSLGVVYEVSSRIWRDKYASDRCPVWSPDGKKIAFVRSGSSNESETLIVMDAQKGIEKSVYTAGQIDCVSWTGDGRALIIQTRRLMSVKRPGAQGEVGKADSTEPAAITTTPGYPEIWLLQLTPRPKTPIDAGSEEATVDTEPNQAEDASALARVYICPSRLGLQPGAKQQFKVFGTDAAGNSVPLESPAVWESDGSVGTVSADGLFTAGDRVGVHEAAVRVMVGMLSASSTVEILSKATEGAYTLQRVIGGPVPGLFCSPCSVAVDGDGCVYIADSESQCVQKLDRDGIPIGRLDQSDLARGNVYGQPASVAVDSKGNIFVCGYNGVKKYDRSLKLVSEWRHTSSLGNSVWGAGYFVAVDRSDNLYVVNASADRIEKFDPSGRLVATFNPAGTGEGKICRPGAIALDSDGCMYIVDDQNECVQKLSSSGEPLMRFGPSADANERLSSPCGVAVDKNGRVYVWDGSIHNLKMYSANGKYVGRSNSLPTACAWSSYDGSVAVGPDGSVFATSIDEHIVRKFSSTGEYLATYGIPGVTNGIFRSPSAIATDAANNLYLVDPATSAIQKFDADGAHVATWSGRDVMNLRSYMQVCANGKCYIVGNGKLAEFDSAIGPPWFYVSGITQNDWESVCDAVVTESGTVYAIVCRQNELNILKREPGGDTVTIFEAWKQPDHKLNFVSRLAVDKDGRVYVTNTQRDPVIRILPDGTIETPEIKTLSGKKVGSTRDVDIDKNGNVYFTCVVDGGVIVKLDAAGHTVAELALGDYQPVYLDVAEDGRIYTIDPYGDPSVRIYAPLGE